MTVYLLCISDPLELELNSVAQDQINNDQYVSEVTLALGDMTNSTDTISDAVCAEDMALVECSCEPRASCAGALFNNGLCTALTIDANIGIQVSAS